MGIDHGENTVERTGVCDGWTVENAEHRRRLSQPGCFNDDMVELLAARDDMLQNLDERQCSWSLVANVLLVCCLIR